MPLSFVVKQALTDMDIFSEKTTDLEKKNKA